MPASDSAQINTFSELLSPAALKLLSASGNDLVQEIGMDIIRGVVRDVLTGRNLRDSTEVLTRRRIVALNLAMVNLFLQGAASSTDFINQLPYLATEILTQERITKAERWLAQWTLGLNDKAFQNILRDNPALLADYRDRYVQTCHDVIASYKSEYGDMTGTLEVGPNTKAQIDWLLMTYLLNTIGAQTLAIRGSEKSAYGKLFEKLILGALLHILGFRYVPQPQAGDTNRVFWLSTRNQRRESDATLLYGAGQAVRFDIGFIGRGNPEISLDKVTRFEREITVGRTQWYAATIIIVDRIGQNSRIEELAHEMSGTIIQMSGSYWPQLVARELQRIFGFEHELVNAEQNQIGSLIDRALREAPLESFVGL